MRDKTHICRLTLLRWLSQWIELYDCAIEAENEYGEEDVVLLLGERETLEIVREHVEEVYE